MTEQKTTRALSPEAAKLVAKIEAKAAATVAPLAREMRILAWPSHYRAIMWEAVAAAALVKAGEAKDGK